MQLSPEQQKAIEGQKAQCPFCKIVKGELQSKKVYEDDHVLAILDINPAAKGHLLVMPKEHYPIMPLIPPEIFDALFIKTKRLSNAVKEGMLVFGDTILIANGYAAGQQTSHFMLHLIPRENNDGLDFFLPKKAAIDPVKQQEAFQTLQKVLPAMLKARYAKYPLPGGQKLASSQEPVLNQQSEQPVASSPHASLVSPQQSGLGGYSKESLIKLIDSNPQLKELITQYPEQFKQQISSNPRLQKVFANVDIDTVIAHFIPKKIESKYSMDQLVQIINDNPKLKDMLLKQTLVIAEKVKEIPELIEVFEGVDIEKLEREVMKRDLIAEQDVSDILGSFSQKKESELDFSLSPEPEFTSENDNTQEQENQEEEEQDEESSENKQEETSSTTKRQKGADLDLISRLYGEMSQKK